MIKNKSRKSLILAISSIFLLGAIFLSTTGFTKANSDKPKDNNTKMEEQKITADSNKEVKKFVERFYQYCLNRGSDPAGLDSRANQLVSKKLTGAQIASSFIFSQEFMGKKISNKEFIAILYKSLFNRKPDAGEYKYWLDLLKSGKTRQFVLASFINSKEFKNLCKEYNINPGKLDPGAATPTTQAQAPDKHNAEPKK